MRLQRLWRHLMTSRRQRDRCFPQTALKAIAAATQQLEATHHGQLRFVLETRLDIGSVWRGVTPRQRALEVFSLMRIWDTEHNNGVLVYVLLADRDVEIVADRGIHRQVGYAGWQAICDVIREAFRRGEFEAGAIRGLRLISERLAQHFPPSGDTPNELSDQPVVM